MDVRRAFGERVRRLRLQRGLSQEALAEQAGLHWTYISGVERGRRSPGLNVIAKLAAALHVTLGKLVEGLDYDRPSRT